jgi:hypothetical protein
VALEIARLGMPAGVTNPGHDLTAVLQNVTGLYIVALPNGLATTGLLPAGTADTGWFQLDDLQAAMQ